MGSSSEVAGASSGWLEKPAPQRGQSVASAPRSGLCQVAGPAALAGSLLSGLELQHRLERTLVPARGGGGQRGRHCLACECISLTCKSGSAGASRPSARCLARARATGQEPGQGRGVWRRCPASRLPGILQFSLFSLFSSPLASPRANPRSA